jgi:hypothetical protein
MKIGLIFIKIFYWKKNNIFFIRLTGKQLGNFRQQADDDEEEDEDEDDTKVIILIKIFLFA